MLPLLRPNELLTCEPVGPEEVQAGDIIAARLHRGAWVTHRVVRVLRVDRQTTFLTKGDNRLLFDPLILPCQLGGRVVRAGGKDFRRPFWQRVGRLLARISYGEALLYQRLSCSRLNRIRHRWEKEGRLPRLALRRWVAAFLNPVRLWPAAWPAKILRGVSARLALRSSGTRVGCASEGDAEAMAALWNACFPLLGTTAERIRQRMFRRDGFDPSGCLALWRGERLLGWGLARLSAPADGRPRRSRHGEVEWMAVGDEGLRRGFERVLFEELLSWLRRRKVVRFGLGPIPLDGASRPDFLNRLLLRAAEAGFQAGTTLGEKMLTPENYRPLKRRDGLRGVAYRPWQEGDEPWFRAGLSGEGYDPQLVPLHLACGGRADRVWVAAIGERPVGLCQWLPDAEMVDYRQTRWIWLLAEPGAARGYIYHWVVDDSVRGTGIGEGLLQRAIESLFQQGCVEAIGWRDWPGRSLERLGFRLKGRFMRMVRDDSF